MRKIYNKILFGTDGSFHANNAAERIIEFQKGWNCEVVVFHSIKHHNLPSKLHFNDNILHINSRNSEELRREVGKEILEKTKKIFERAHLLIKTRLIEDKAPEEYIKKIVEVEGFDLVVLGCKGRHSKLQEILLGTVSTKILKHVLCDTLIVR